MDIKNKIESLDLKIDRLSIYVRKNYLVFIPTEFIWFLISFSLLKNNYNLMGTVGMVLLIYFLFVFQFTDKSRDIIIGCIGVIIVSILLLLVILNNEVKDQSMDTLKNILLCLLTNILLLYDSIKEKRERNKVTTLQVWRFILTIILIFGVVISIFININLVIDLWTVGVFFVYFIPLIFIPKKQK